MSEKNHSNSNGRKDHNSKGQQNPKSRNPAAGEQARSLSSPHSTAVGNVARGGQEPQPAPFVRAIVSCITKSAKDHNVDINFHVIVAFANDYASHMPSKMQDFRQSDVEQALVAFQAVYEPPQPQPPPNMEKKKYKLQQMIVSAIMDSANQDEVDVRPEDAAAFAYDYASRYIASNPTRRFTDGDVQRALEIFKQEYIPPEQPEQQVQTHHQQTQGEQEAHREQEAAILARRTQQQQAVQQRNDSLRKQEAQRKRDDDARHKMTYPKFYDVLQNGASRKNLGEDIFSNLKAQGLPDGMIFAFHRSPSIGHFQMCMCIRKKSGDAICGFARGWNFSENGSMNAFKQSVVLEPTFMKDTPVLVIPSTLGYFIYKHEVTEAEDKTKGGDHFSDAFYAGVGGEYSGDPFRNAACIGDALKEAIRGIVPKRMDEIRSSPIIRQQILASPEFQARYTEAMRALGGIPVRLHEDVQQQDASDSFPSFSEAKDESINPWGAAAYD
jgi:hypothetical protein